MVLFRKAWGREGKAGLFCVHISRHLFIGILESSHVRFLAPSSSPALDNEGLFELTRCPSLTRVISSSFAETTKEHSCSQGKKPKLVKMWSKLVKMCLFHLTTTGFLCSFCRWQRDSPCQRRAPSQLKKLFVGEGRRGGISKEMDESRFKLWNSLKLFPKEHIPINFSPMNIGENGSIFIPGWGYKAQK